MQKILIVEDEAAIANLIKINLEAEGYQCTCAFDGRAGADHIEQETFDLVLLDIMLPEIDGYELLEYVKPMGTPVISICISLPSSLSTYSQKTIASRRLSTT